MPPLRFVILQHDFPHLHYDLMLEHGDTLRSWRLRELPTLEKKIIAEETAPHRLAYLDYEGPVSGNRGHVIRWDRGTFQGNTGTEPVVTVLCQGEKIRGFMRLQRKSGKEWEAFFSLTLPARSASEVWPRENPMDTLCLRLNPDHPDEATLAAAGKLLRE